MFLQYLWGIETLPRQNYLRPTTGFYSTYEELKHVREGKTLPNTSSFYSTYEELKLALPLELNWGPESFYSTYEELKHKFSTCLVILFMSFLQYLWGIETYHAVFH